MKRTLPFFPDYEIDHDGVIRTASANAKLPHCSVKGRFGLVHLGVELNGTRHFIWKLLSTAFYDNSLLLPRDGNFLNWQQENTVVLQKISSATITDPDEIHLIWKQYNSGTTTRMMSEKANLPYYGHDDFRSIIKDILIAGIR